MSWNPWTGPARGARPGQPSQISQETPGQPPPQGTSSIDTTAPIDPFPDETQGQLRDLADIGAHPENHPHVNLPPPGHASSRPIGPGEAAPGSGPVSSSWKSYDGSVWDPWQQGPPQPHWYSGMGFSEDTAYLGPLYRALEGAGQGAAKGEELLAGLWHAPYALGARLLGDVPGVGGFIKAGEQETSAMQEIARQRVKDLTPDPATTGVAAQAIASVASGAYRMVAGSLLGGPVGGAGLVGSTEAADRYTALREAGVTPGAAAASAGVTGAASFAGAFLPAGFGGTLARKIVSGAMTNAAFGGVSRYEDHLVLEAAGYPEMAHQERFWDGQAMLTDLLLGGAFGAIAHAHEIGAAPEEEGSPGPSTAQPTAGAGRYGSQRLRELELSMGRDAPGAEDAALTMNLAMRDRRAAPGVAVDPASANAHQAALEKATEDLLQGRPVNVADTGIDNATFAVREPAQDQVTNVAPLRMPEPEQPADIGEFPIDAANQSRAKAPFGANPQRPIDMGGASADELLARYRQPPETPEGVGNATFAERPAPDLSQPEALYRNVMTKMFRESGFLDEQQKLSDLEEQLAQRYTAARPWERPESRPADANYANMRPWEMAVADNPDMQIPGQFVDGSLVSGRAVDDRAQGTVNAGDALKQANDNVAEGQQKIPDAMNAVANCAARRAAQYATRPSFIARAIGPELHPAVAAAAITVPPLAGWGLGKLMESGDDEQSGAEP
jgi:hypothetical protein